MRDTNITNITPITAWRKVPAWASWRPGVEVEVEVKDLEDGQYSALVEGFEDEAVSCLSHYLSDRGYEVWEVENLVGYVSLLYFGDGDDLPLRLGDPPTDLEELPPYEVGRALYQSECGREALESYRDYLRGVLDDEESLAEPDTARVAQCRKLLLDVFDDPGPSYFGEDEDEEEEEEE